MLTPEGELYFGDVLMALTAAASNVDVTELPHAQAQRLLRRAAEQRRKQLQAAGHGVAHAGGGGGAGWAAVVWASGGKVGVDADHTLVPVSAILATLLLQRVARRWLEKRRHREAAAGAVQAEGEAAATADDAPQA